MAYMGFGKLKAALAKKGARNPGAVAAKIGREKYGEARMARAAAEHKPITKVKKG